MSRDDRHRANCPQRCTIRVAHWQLDGDTKFPFTVRTTARARLEESPGSRNMEDARSHLGLAVGKILGVEWQSKSRATV